VPDGGGRNHYLAERCGRPYVQVNGTGTLVDVREAPAARSWLERLLRRSELYANLVPTAGDGRATFADWDVFTGRNAAAVSAAWGVTRALVEELDRQVRANGGRLAVVLIPHEREARVGSAPASVQIDFERAHALAEAFLGETRIPYVDLYPSLRAAVGRGERPYLNRDMHWNGHGHDLVAAALERWLVDHCATLRLPLAVCPAAGRSARATHKDVDHHAA